MDFWIWYDKLNFAVTLLAAELAVCAPLPKRRHYAARMALGCIPAAACSLAPLGRQGAGDVALGHEIPRRLRAVLRDDGRRVQGGMCGRTCSWASLLTVCSTSPTRPTPSSTRSLGWPCPVGEPAGPAGPLRPLLYSGAWLLFKKRLSRDEGIRVDNKPQLFAVGRGAAGDGLHLLLRRRHALNSGNHGSVIIICLFSDMACLLSLALEQSFVRLKKNETEMAVMRHMLSAAKYQLQESKSSIDLINVKCHDLRHQLTALSFADKEELQKARRRHRGHDTDFKTGNEALDIVLMEKGLLCQRKKVRMTCLVNGVHLNGMKQSDIYSFFCNALENAMESVEALNEDRRAISITELCRDDFFVIRIENFFPERWSFRTDCPSPGRTAATTASA